MRAPAPPICIAVALWSSELQLKQPNLVYINPVLFAVQECCFVALVGSWYLVFVLNAMQLTHIYYCHARMRVKYPEKGGEHRHLYIAQRPLLEVAGGEVSRQQKCLVDVIVDEAYILSPVAVSWDPPLINVRIDIAILEYYISIASTFKIGLLISSSVGIWLHQASNQCAI